VYEGVDHNGQDEVHDEEVADYQIDQGVNNCKGRMVYVHHVVHERAPIVRGDHLVDEDQRVQNVVEVRYSEEDLFIGGHVF